MGLQIGPSGVYCILSGIGFVGIVTYKLTVYFCREVLNRAPCMKDTKRMAKI